MVAAASRSCIVLAGPALGEKLTSDEARFSIDVPDAPQVRYLWSDPSGDRTWVLSFNGEAKPTIARADREKRYDAAVKTVIDRAKECSGPNELSNRAT